MLLILNAKLRGKDKLQGILIENEVIQDIDDSEKLEKKYKDVKVIDATGRRVIPGLNDSHLHLIGYAGLKRNLRLENAKSISEVISLGKEYFNKHNNLSLIVGNLYNDNNFEEKRILVKEDLDQIAKDIPIICYRVCGHICTINSKAIEVLNLNIDSRVEGGSLDVVNGELTGVLRENALTLVHDLFEVDYSVEDYKDFILEGIEDANKVGVTSLQPNDISGNLNSAKKIYQAYKELNKADKLNARINLQITFSNTSDLEEFLEFVDFENNYLKVGPLKLFIDGSLGAKTAAMFDNYLDDNQNGILCLSKEELGNFLEFAKSNQRQVIVHAIGDRGISLVLDEFSNINIGLNDLRNAIVHVQITSKEILDRFKKSQVGAIVQPIFINTDMFMVYSKVKKELANTSYAFNTLFKNTITSFSSDAPVESMNPFLGIYHAITRKDLTGKHTYIPTEAVSLDEAITAYTTNGAYMSFEEKHKGKIEIGYLADLVVLNQDIYEIDYEKIKDLQVDLTIVGGRIVYEK